MTLEEAKKVKVGDRVIARFGSLSLPVECEVLETIEGVDRIRFCLGYQREDGKTERATRTHMRCWGIRRFSEQEKEKEKEKEKTKTEKNKSDRYDNYEFWEKEWLIDRIKQLENEVCLFRDDKDCDMVSELAKMQLELEKAENLIQNQKTEIQVLRSYIAKKKEEK